jgi:hypothetical protein
MFFMREYSQTLLIYSAFTAIPNSEKIHGAYLVENIILEMDSLSRSILELQMP